MTLLELETATLEWSHTRGILTNGKATTQALKLVSEHGELMGNMVDMQDIKDDIGDCLVVLTGQDITTSLGTTEAYNQTGWGRQFWARGYFCARWVR